MKMLDDIIDGAVDDKVSLPTLLRKCLVLADMLKNGKLKGWVLAELNGYETREGLPEYRVLGINAVGLVLGPFQSAIKDQPIPASLMEKDHQHWATTAYMTQPISAYENLSKQASGDSLAIPWPSDLVALYQDKFFAHGRALNRAHQVIPVSSLSGIVDQVRNKLLEFALELRNEIGTDEPTPQNPPPAVVEKQVTNIIYGGQTNVYGGTVSGDVVQGSGHTVVKGDFVSLGKALADIGIPERTFPKLKSALDDDQVAGHTKGIGPKTDGWLQSTLKGLGKGALKVTNEVAVKVATGAILAYIGAAPAS